MTAESTAARRRATGRTLLIVSALGAAGFAGWSLAQLQLATSQTFLSEAWHALGLIVFAGLFALVAWRPRAYPGLMELTIAHSIGMFVLALTNQDAAGATATMILHGLLALALLTAYIVLGCIKAWGHRTVAEKRSPAVIKRSETASESRTAAADSPAAGPRGRRSEEGAPRRIDRTPKGSTQSDAQPGTAPGTQPGQTGTQPITPMSQELPEDRPRD